MDVGQEDPSQAFALASIWLLILGFGGSVFLLPVIYTLGQAYHQDAFHSATSHTSQASMLQFLTILNGMMYMALGSIIGVPIASASGNQFGVIGSLCLLDFFVWFITLETSV